MPDRMRAKFPALGNRPYVTDGRTRRARRKRAQLKVGNAVVLAFTPLEARTLQALARQGRDNGPDRTRMENKVAASAMRKLAKAARLEAWYG